MLLLARGKTLLTLQRPPVIQISTMPLALTYRHLLAINKISVNVCTGPEHTSAEPLIAHLSNILIQLLTLHRTANSS